MLDPLRKIMAEYRLLLIIMQVDQISTQMVKVNVIKISTISTIFSFLCDFSFFFSSFFASLYREFHEWIHERNFAG